MRVAVLFSGGKDSAYSLFLASKYHEVVCLINVNSLNAESYMFQTKGQEIVKLQALSLNIPLEICKTSGVKEKEVEDLEKNIIKLKKKYKFEGIVTGAIKSSYQALRIERISSNLDLWCFNPLWQKEEKKYLKELLENKFEILIVSISSYPLTKKFVGKILDSELVEKLYIYHNKGLMNCAGEGGEFETIVLDMPLFEEKICLKSFKILEESENVSELKIEEVTLQKK